MPDRRRNSGSGSIGLSQLLADFLVLPARLSYVARSCITLLLASKVVEVLRSLLSRLNQAMSRRRRAVAVAMSLGLHFLFVVAFLYHAVDGLNGPGYGGEGTSVGRGMAIDLVSSEAFHHMALAVKPPSPDSDEKLEALQTAAAETPDALTTVDTSPQLLIDNDSSPDSAAPSGSAGDGGVGNVGDDLWGAIAPCWKRLADKNTLPVTLEVSFAADGNLAKPPVIDRNTEGNDAQAQRSEAIALAALSQCGAYAMADNQENVIVNFPRP